MYSIIRYRTLLRALCENLCALCGLKKNGNSVWNTYFGSDGYEEVFGSTLTILGNRIIIAGSQYGAVSNISTPGAHLTAPSNTSNNLTNMFFGEFDSSGSRLWCSYFGGAGINMFQEHINPELLSDGTLVLWGTTGATTGIGTEGVPYQSMTNPYPGFPFGFVTRFVFKDELGTSETAGLSADIQLYNNPNNGSFTLSGSVLAKEATVVALYDTAGRLVKKKRFHVSKNRISAGDTCSLLEITSCRFPKDPENS